eukprot:CAMPEP_0174269534 /NCGR_PEP_ID=MMETSP0439-20130205/41401_1 /TAXON_ID=0 /ORGANISM="Stereomyxa ramosa, Strain Chinc5" /LENGTH=164 /DNA_ID=CAMNT_0015358371 /DNA_START=482 /DNA_END=973 /DNA_ORIENTATION=-
MWSATIKDATDEMSTIAETSVNKKSEGEEEQEIVDEWDDFGEEELTEEEAETINHCLLSYKAASGLTSGVGALLLKMYSQHTLPDSPDGFSVSEFSDWLESLLHLSKELSKLVDESACTLYGPQDKEEIVEGIGQLHEKIEELKDVFVQNATCAKEPTCSKIFE